MNKLTKIGVSALCGSLASVAAANAGSLDVTGGATATYTSLEGEVTGNPLGMASGMTFTGSGELDNGWTWSTNIDIDADTTQDDSSIVLGMGGLGSLKINILKRMIPSHKSVRTYMNLAAHI